MRDLVLGTVVGVFAGAGSFAFLKSLEWATDERLAHDWLRSSGASCPSMAAADAARVAYWRARSKELRTNAPRQLLSARERYARRKSGR